MQLELSKDEVEILEEILTSELGNLREQIYKAEVADYKALLKQRESVISSLLDRARAPGV
jgi:hypothetical protein